jgi:hypothetical protein
MYLAYNRDFDAVKLKIQTMQQAFSHGARASGSAVDNSAA